MIAFLHGILSARSGDRLLLDVNGVGYAIHVPISLSPGPMGTACTIHTHMVVREDAMTLYGFANEEDRDTFAILLGVNGVGPKVALSAVDTLGSHGLRAAVVGEQVQQLMLIPGVGRKGAQKMILELREKLSGMSATSTSQGLPGPAALSGPRDEARAALASLGYSVTEIEGAIAGVEGRAEEIIHTALRALAKG